MRRYGGVESQPVSEIKSGIKLGIFGPGGVGKTTLAGTVCESDYGWPALYLDARGNPHVISRYAERLQVIKLQGYKHAEAVRQDVLKDRDCPFKSVIIDNVSEILALDLRDRYGGADPNWQQHSATTADILALVRNWCDMADAGPKLNVIFVLWEVPEKRTIRGQDLERSELALNKALQTQVPGIVSWLGRLYIVSGAPRFTRMLDFTPDETVSQAKFQIDPEDPRTRDIPMQIYNPSLATILDTIKGGIVWPTERHTKPSLKASRE